MNQVTQADRAGDEAELTQVPVDHLDYGYIGQCESADELKAILRYLQSGKEGRWADLERFCEERLIDRLPPKEKRLYVAQRFGPTASQVEEATNDLTQFLQSISKRDESLRCAKGVKGTKESSEEERIFEEEQADKEKKQFIFPPVRGEFTEDKADKKKAYDVYHTEEQKQEAKESKASKRISAYDFRAWDKFDVDKELERIDREEQRLKEEREREIAAKQAKIDERRKATEAARSRLGLPENVEVFSDAQRVFFAEREKEKGNECFNAQEYENAVRFYSRSIAFLPQSAKDPRPFTNRAMAYLKLERWEDAETDCDRAIEIDPTFAKAFARRGMARHRRGKYLDAIEDFEEALHLEPKNTKLNNLLAESRKKYHEVGGIGADRASAPPRNTASGSSSKPENFKKLMIIEDSDDEDDEEPEQTEQQGTQSVQHDESEESVEVVEDSGVTWVDAKRNGSEEFKRGSFTKAIEWFSISIELLETKLQQDPSAVQDLCNCIGNRAVCYKELGQWSGVIQECDRILSLAPKNVKALFRRGTAHESLGNINEALEDMCQVLRLDPNLKEAGDRISVLMDRLNHPEKFNHQSPTETTTKTSTATTQQKESSQEDNSEDLKEQGNTLFKQGDLQGAVDKYTAALEVDPSNVSALANRAMAYLKMNRFEQALVDCDAGLKLSKSDSTGALALKLFYRRASSLSNLGRLAEACEDLRHVLKMEPQNKRAVSELAQLEERIQGDARRKEEQARLEKIKESQQVQDALTEKAKAKAKAKVASQTNFRQPKTSYEFQRTWRPLSLEQRQQYLATLSPQLFHKLFRVELEDELLMEIVQTLESQQDQDLAKSFLEEIASLERIETTLRFLSSEHKEKLSQLATRFNIPKLIRQLS